MRKPFWMVLCVGLGCTPTNREAAPARLPPVDAQTIDAGSSDAGAAAAALPKELAILATGATVEAGPFAWPPGGASAIVRRDSGSFVVWKTAKRAGRIELPRPAARAVVQDVRHVGSPELIIFASPLTKPLEEHEDPSMVQIIGMAPGDRPARLWLLEGQLLGATDEASLARELLANQHLGPTSAPLPRLIARLSQATPDEVKALVGPGGLKLCKRYGTKRSCTAVATSTIDAKQVARILKTGGAFAPFSYDPDGDSAESGAASQQLQPPRCSPVEDHADRITCIASVGGPSGGEWVFDVSPGHERRLIEVWTWGEET